MERKARITDKGKSQASSKQKALDVTRRSSKDRVAQSAEQQRLHNKPGSALESATKPKDLKIKPGDRRMSDSRQRQPDATQSSRQSLQRNFAALYLSERSRNAGQRRENPTLRGGGGPDDSSSQQQGESSKKQETTDSGQRDFSGQRNFKHSTNSPFRSYFSETEFNEFSRLLAQSKEIYGHSKNQDKKK